jgi:antitoxin HicB
MLYKNRWPEGVEKMKNSHIGSSLDDFLKDENIYEETQAQAIKEVIAWQLIEAMRQKSMSKTRMAALLKISRTQIDRLLDPAADVTLSTLQRAAALVGRKVQIDLI